METLASIEAFVHSAQLGSFSSAARKLALTPAGISKSVAKLEQSLGVRLFQRTTRTLKLTDAGEQLLSDVAPSLGALQEGLARVSSERHEPVGILKVSLAPAFGRDYVLPIMPAYLAACPRVTPELHFENRQVDLIGEGYDVAVGAGLELGAGIVARELARIAMVTVASKAYIKKRGVPKAPGDLSSHDLLAFLSPRTRKIRTWSLRGPHGQEAHVNPRPRMVVSEFDALAASLRAGVGVGLVPTSQVLRDLETGSLVRVMPEWHGEGGPILAYFSSQRLLPARTRAFVDILAAHFKAERLTQRFSADAAQPRPHKRKSSSARA